MNLRAHLIGWAVVVLFLLAIAFVDGLGGGGVPKVAGAEPVRGVASTYDHTAGFEGQATVALPAKLGGKYVGAIYAFVTVCADRCATFPAVDYCECVVPESAQPNRIIDLSHAAWKAVTDRPFGLIDVTVTLVEHDRGVPDTAMR